MEISLNLVQIYTNRGKNGHPYYNVKAVTEKGNAYSITTPVLYLNTEKAVLFLSDDIAHNVYDYAAQDTLPTRKAKKFMEQLANGIGIKDVHTIAQEKAANEPDNAGQDEEDDVPF